MNPWYQLFLLKFFFTEITEPIDIKLGNGVLWNVLHKMPVFCVSIFSSEIVVRAIIDNWLNIGFKRDQIDSTVYCVCVITANTSIIVMEYFQKSLKKPKGNEKP